MSDKLNQKIYRFFHLPMAVLLFLLGLFFAYLAVRLALEACFGYFSGRLDWHSALEQIFFVMLFIEMVTAVKIYFRENFHFPLRFFFYVGITDGIRYIIVHPADGGRIFFNALVVFFLVIALAILEVKNYYLARRLRREGGTFNEL